MPAQRTSEACSCDHLHCATAVGPTAAAYSETIRKSQKPMRSKHNLSGFADCSSTGTATASDRLQSAAALHNVTAMTFIVRYWSSCFHRGGQLYGLIVFRHARHAWRDSLCSVRQRGWRDKRRGWWQVATPRFIVFQLSQTGRQERHARHDMCTGRQGGRRDTRCGWNQHDTTWHAADRL